MRLAKLFAAASLVAGLLTLAACDSQHAENDGHSHDETNASDTGESGLPPGVIAVPPGVRDNLGITFVPVERRVVLGTKRLPGRFEATPSAKAEYRAGARGTVTPLVQQYSRVQPGDLLYRLESETWRDIQTRLAQAELARELVSPQEQAAQRASDAAKAGVEVWRARLDRLKELQQSGAAQAAQLSEAASELAAAEGALASAMERVQAVQVESLSLRDPAGRNPRFDIALREAATLFGAGESWLLDQVDGQPRWKTLRSIEVRARQGGVVQSVDVVDGGLVESGGLVLQTLEPREVRFRGFALQADLGFLLDGAVVRLVPPHGGIASYTESIEASLVLGVEADPDERTVDLIATPAGNELPAWARPGIAAFVEVVVSGSHDEELAIPIGAVVGDGLDRVFFLRDRTNPDQVRRVVADLGGDDGRWIIVNSGVRSGDEVVLDGVYELQLTGSGTEQKGGHFHADGTFHAGED